MLNPSRALRLAALSLPLLLAACGADNPPAEDPPQDCSVTGHKLWLDAYMDEWYFWYAQSPDPDVARYADVASYFDARLFTGVDIHHPGFPSDFPADRWSRSESTESFNRFFGDGATLGYGISVAGLEVTGEPAAPLYVRYVEPQSPAAPLGVQRGDQILSINGRSSAQLIADDDYSLLSPSAAGQTVTLQLRRGGVDRTVVVSAAVYTLTPVTGAAVVDSPRGRRIGYVAVKDMIGQAQAPLASAFASFRAAGVDDVVLDLRYNGGGLVTTGATLASYVAGTRGNGLNYATLLYNDQRASRNNESFRFSSPANALGLGRVFVLTGQRTCSASEQVINGLRGAGVDVVAIGDTTCGKPVGFLPASACGRTYSVVNFESVNQRNEGRYFDGFDATCPVSEDFTAAQGSGADPLMAAAAQVADTGQCPAMAAGRQQPMSARAARASRPLAWSDGDERQGMVPR